ncbi:MAG: DUF5678 domain-containing protein [Blastocatellia bacterium]
MADKPLHQTAMEVVQQIGPENLDELIRILQREQSHPGMLAEFFAGQQSTNGAEPARRAASDSAASLGTRLNLDSEAPMRWLRENRAAYGGQWIALDADRLIAHSEVAADVYAAAAEAGVSIPFVTFIEPADALPRISPYAIYS